MKTFILHRLASVVFLIIFVIATAPAQSSLIWIKVNFTAERYTDSLIFGNHTEATYGIDSVLEEHTCPDPLPDSYDSRWNNISGHTNTWGTGLCSRDIRGVSNILQKDTFQLAFFDGAFPDSTISFSWPYSTTLSEKCDSLLLVYFDPAIPGNVTINMFQQSSLVVPAAGANGIGVAKIYKYGAKIIDGVGQSKATVPASFILRQNYPNPFNPTTKMSFVLGHSSLVTLRIFDVFGREVATLINKEMAPGSYMQEWNAGNVASGIYYYRLSAGEFTEVKKMVVVR